MKYDLSFDQWVQLVFDHPVTDPHWYWDDSLSDYWDQWGKEFGVKKQLQYATKLFSHAAKLLIGKYSPGQIDQGLGMFISGPRHFAVDNLVWLKALPRPLRAGCITSMVPLFRELFSVVPVEFSCFMWWDHLREWEHEDVDTDMREVVFQALTAILEIPSQDCQLSALHGLNHLKHPDKGQMIREFLVRNPDASDSTRDFANSAIEGKMM